MEETITSYKRIRAVCIMDDILKTVANRKAAPTAKDISEAVGVPKDTLMCYLATMQDRGYITADGGSYRLGMANAVFWARTKARLEADRAAIDDELKEIGVEES